MSIRDEFAIAALQGLLANKETGGFDGNGDLKPDLLATWAYSHADAMLKAREK